MSPVAQLLSVVALGLFWGLSPTFYKLMANEGIPISQIIVLSGVGVAAGLAVLRLAVRGQVTIGRDVLLYGLGCGALLNIPFALGLYVAHKLPVTILGVVAATGPLWSYLLAILFGRERPTAFRLAALSCGFLSSALLIATRGAVSMGDLSGWVLVAMLCPILYAFYNLFAAMAWPKGMDTLAAGTAESLGSAALVLPVMLALEPVRGIESLHWGYWTLAAITLLWVAERIAFFTMMRDAGPVTTGQAVYVSTPASVLFGVVLLGETADNWIWASLALLMTALWLNNRAIARQRLAA